MNIFQTNAVNKSMLLHAQFTCVFYRLHVVFLYFLIIFLAIFTIR